MNHDDFHQNQAEARDLEERASRVGLDWSVKWKRGDEDRDFAFHLVEEDGRPVVPSQVIGETVEGARDTISLAAATKKKKRTKQPPGMTRHVMSSPSAERRPPPTPVELLESAIVPRWKESSSGFLKHFDVEYDDFCKTATVMADRFPDKMRRYEQIRALDEEAAILWLIKHARSYGILK
jgi:hypothetical protein